MKKRGNRSQMVIATQVAKLDTRPGLKAANIAAACDDSHIKRRTSANRAHSFFRPRHDNNGYSTLEP
jgi:hypothetical protein